MKKDSPLGQARGELLKSKEFNDYSVAVSINLIRLVVAVIGVFNIVLIVADFMNIDGGAGRTLALVLRLVFIFDVIVLLVWIKWIKRFRMMALVVTLYEIAAAVLTVYVFSIYRTPDFLMQLVGVMVIVLVVFVLPNLWTNKIVVALVCAVGFLIYAIFTQASLPIERIFTAAMYILLEILICASFSLYYRRWQREEFLSKKELLRIYSTDPLTKVGNRIMLEDEAELWMEFCSRHGLALSLVLIDIDDMKKINDEHGHLVGDIVLYEAAQVMSGLLRRNDVCVRWGGDEFVLLLPKTNVEQARKLSVRIQEAFIRQEVAENLRITCSFGITSMRKGDSLDLLVQQADASMYAAKKKGKNSIVSNSERLA